MATLKLRAADIIVNVRRHLDQIPYGNEDVMSDSSVIGSPSTQFSDANLLDRINAGQRAIISKVKAMHVPLAIHRYDTAAGDTLPIPSLEYDRLLYSRVLYTGAAGDPTNNAPYDPQGFFSGTPTFPEVVYQLIAGRVITITGISLSTGTNPTTTHSLLVTVDGTSVATIAVNTSGTHVTTIGGGSFVVKTGQVMQIEVSSSGFDAADLTFAFTATAEVFTTDTVEGQRCRQRSVDRHRRLENTVGSAGQTPGRQATGAYPVFTFEDGELNVYPTGGTTAAFFVQIPNKLTTTNITNQDDFLLIDERFEAALTFWVCSSCWQTMKRIERSQLYAQAYRDEIAPYARTNRFNSVIDDREIDVE
jgi:hypothetical protein